MKYMVKFGIASIMVASLVACNNNNDDTVVADEQETTPPVEQSQGAIRVIHASSDAPKVNILAGDAIFSGLEKVDYKVGSGLIDLDTGTYSITVAGVLPDGSTTNVIGPADIAIEKDVETTVIAVGKTANIEPLIITNDEVDVAADMVSVQVVHASPEASEAAAGAVDVYVTAASDDLESAAPLGSFDFKGTLGPVEVAAADYRIRVTPTGTKTVVYDTGETGVTLSGGAELLILAVDNTTASNSPISLLVNDGTNTSSILDAATPVKARVVHASPDAPEVEVFATPEGHSEIELIPAFSYRDIVPGNDSYVDVAATNYTFDVAPNTNTIGDSVFTSASLSLAAGEFYTVFANGRLAAEPDFRLTIATGDNRSIATEAKVKVVHAAPAAGTVDVYVTSAGDYSAEEVAAGTTVTPTLADFEFDAITDFLSLAPGSYDIRVVAGGAAAINVENVELTGGSVTTIAAVGPSEGTNHAFTDFGALVLTD